MTTLHMTKIRTPLCSLLAIAHGDKLVGLEFANENGRETDLKQRLTRYLGDYTLRETSDPAGVATRLKNYFAGDIHALDSQPVEMHGTAFERAVWAELLKIPVGETISYATLAKRVGRPNGPRAVGQANGRNPVALVVPCHRVIAADGTLGGYGGGLELKRRLLEHERALEPALV